MAIANYSHVSSSEDLSEKEDGIDTESQPALSQARSTMTGYVRRAFVKQKRLERTTILHGIMLITNLVLAVVLLATHLSQNRESSLIYCTLDVAATCDSY